MEHELITISFLNFTPSSLTPVPFAELDWIRSAGVGPASADVQIDGLPCGIVVFHLEDEVEEFLGAYAELEEMISSGIHKSHPLILNDGGFMMLAKSTDETINMVITISPKLNRFLSTEYKCDVSMSGYLAGWRNAIHGLAKGGLVKKD